MSGAREKLGFDVKGHFKITDDLGNVLLDKKNAVHPQNMARAISRALANESNFFISRVAFGNGGTTVDAAFQITYNPPNDGQEPDIAGWESRLYNETYSEIVDDSSNNLGSGEGASPSDDPPSIEHLSGPGVRSSEGPLFSSQVTVEVVLNPGEPGGQFGNDQLSPSEFTDSDFFFDEIGIFTSGAPGIAGPGYQNVNVGNKIHTDDTGLIVATTYNFDIVVDNGSVQNISIVTPNPGSGPEGQITFSDLVSLINNQIVGATVVVTEIGVTQTFGYLKFISNTTGSLSSIDLINGLTDDLFSNIMGYVDILPASQGGNQGVQNDPINASTERERLLSHTVFSPVLKSSNRSLTIQYTLTVSVARNI
jgi:hypothetical protein